MADSCVKVARGLLLFGARIGDEGDLPRDRFLHEIAVKESTFRSAAEAIGAKEHDPGLRFFHTSHSHLAFGSGAGLVVGVSVGSESLRAALVDANGELLYKFDAGPMPGQLLSHPDKLLDRIQTVVEAVLAPALRDESLLVQGRLPFLGVSVAWPSPVNRDDRPVGYALAHDSWRGGQTLTQRVARRLSLSLDFSHALNDANAAAIAVAFATTRTRSHQRQSTPRLTLVLRLAGGIGGATVIIEPPTFHEDWGITSGFLRSVLVGGADLIAGELGHVTVPAATVAALNERRPKGLRVLKAHACSCSGGAQSRVPPHLEAYAGAAALARRVRPGGAMSDVLTEVLSDLDRDAHTRALEDVAALVAESLHAPVAWLNPASIVLTGALATRHVERELDRRLADAHPIASHPVVVALEGDANRYIRAQGAALAVLRRHVHREFASLLGAPKKTLPARVQGLTRPLGGMPWL